MRQSAVIALAGLLGLVSAEPERRPPFLHKRIPDSAPTGPYPTGTGAAGQPQATCSFGNVYEPAPAVTAPKHNVWAQISAADHHAVWDFLHSSRSGLNLTDPYNATQADNYVHWIDTAPQNKSAVLPYLRGTGAKPSKYARVVVFEGAQGNGKSQEYTVGPLPVSEKTVLTPLNWIFNGGSGGSVPFDARYLDDKRTAAAGPILVGAMIKIADITNATFGRVYLGPDNSDTNLEVSGGSPTSFDGTRSFAILSFNHPGPASYLQPIDFYLLADVTGLDASKYSILGFVTKGKLFETEAELRAAFEKGELVQEFPQTNDPDWGRPSRGRDLPVRDLEHRFAPATLPLGGKRYRFDPDERFVSYLGWTFYIAHTRTLGVMMYDIRFKGESIVYELSMQEAMAQYGGNQPRTGSTMYHDTYFNLGATAGALIEGLDCPFGSTMIDLTFHYGNETDSVPRSLCLFESDPGLPVSRHRSGEDGTYGFSYLSAVKDSALVVRWVATVGNYDYMFDYSFHADASFNVDVRASGFIQAGAYYAAQAKWGPRVGPGTQGSLHDHIITFKADFDLVDTANSIEQTDLIVVNQTQPWFNLVGLGPFEQIELAKKTKPTEEQFNWAANGQTMYAIVNEATKNEWGVSRGYRIIPGLSNIHLTVRNSPFSSRNSEFAKSQLAVTRQHDSEPYANSWQNANLPFRPQHDFSKTVNGESIEQEDLVVWFNLGMHHFTRSEDVPLTLFTEAHTSIMFSPHNFFNTSQDVDLTNRRWITVSDDAQIQSDDYGVPVPAGLTEPAQLIQSIGVN